jgi:hypothetical protein
VQRHEDGTIAIKDEVGDIGYEGTRPAASSA